MDLAKLAATKLKIVQNVPKMDKSATRTAVAKPNQYFQVLTDEQMDEQIKKLSRGLRCGKWHVYVIEIIAGVGVRVKAEGCALTESAYFNPRCKVSLTMSVDTNIELLCQMPVSARDAADRAWK